MTSTFVFAGIPCVLNVFCHSGGSDVSHTDSKQVVDRFSHLDCSFHGIFFAQLQKSGMRRIIPDGAAIMQALFQKRAYLKRVYLVIQRRFRVKVFNAHARYCPVGKGFKADSQKGAARARRQAQYALSFFKKSFGGLRNTFVRLYPAGYRPNNLIFDKKRHPSARRTSTDSNVSGVIKLRQVFNADEILMVVIRISRSSPRLRPIALDELKRFFIQTGAAMRANVFGTKHD